MYIHILGGERAKHLIPRLAEARGRRQLSPDVLYYMCCFLFSLVFSYIIFVSFLVVYQFSLFSSTTYAIFSI